MYGCLWDEYDYVIVCLSLVSDEIDSDCDYLSKYFLEP